MDNFETAEVMFKAMKKPLQEPEKWDMNIYIYI